MRRTCRGGLVCLWLCVLGNRPQSTFSTHIHSSLTWRADEANEKEESVTPHRTSLFIRAEIILSQRHADLILVILKHKIRACFLLMQLECMAAAVSALQTQYCRRLQSEAHTTLQVRTAIHIQHAAVGFHLECISVHACFQPCFIRWISKE